MHRALTLAALLALAAPAANAFTADNGLIVRATGETSFEVPYRGLSGATDFWNAAGDYVVKALDLPPTTPIYRISPVPRRSGQGISFSLSPAGAQPTGLLLWGRSDGISAALARVVGGSRINPR